MIKKVMKIYKDYNNEQKKDEDKIDTEYEYKDDKCTKLFMFLSHKLTAENRGNVHKHVINYLLKTRKDLYMERYQKGGCIKMDHCYYKEKWEIE